LIAFTVIHAAVGFATAITRVVDAVVCAATGEVGGVATVAITFGLCGIGAAVAGCSAIPTRTDFVVVAIAVEDTLAFGWKTAATKGSYNGHHTKQQE
jgi:hypothetical protein